MTSTLRRFGSLLIAALAAAAVVAPAAEATFGASINLSATGGNPSAANVDLDADGDAVFVWTREVGADSLVEARARSAAGVLGPVQTLSSPGQDAFDPQVGVSDAGEAVFVWRRFDGTNYRVQTRARTSAGALSPVQTLSAGTQDALEPQIAVTAFDGDAVYAWRRSDGDNSRVQARSRTFAGALSPVETLSKDGVGNDAFNPRVDVDSVGNAAFAWQRFDVNEADFRIEARGRTSGGALGPLTRISPSGSSSNPDVEVDADGSDAVFVWTRFVGGNNRVQARSVTSLGVLSPVQTLSAAGQDAAVGDLASDAAGNTVFTWLRFDGTNDRIQARPRSAGGALGSVQNVSPAGSDSDSPHVGVDFDGDAVLTWRRLDGGTVYLVEARTRSSAGVIGSVQDISNPTATVDSLDPQIGIAKDGDASVSFIGPNDRVQAAFGP